jgi:hypothetical protein
VTTNNEKRALDAERFCAYGCDCPTYEPERCSDGPCECKCHPTESAFMSDLDDR